MTKKAHFSIIISTFIGQPLFAEENDKRMITRAVPVELPMMMISSEQDRHVSQQRDLGFSTVLQSEYLQQNQVTDFFDLADHVSSLEIVKQNSLFNTKVYIRGLGTSATDSGLSSSVGVMVDDVYQGRIADVMNNLYDLEQVDVINGPQGNLLTHNSSAGVISFQTKQPEFTPTYQLKTSYGSFDDIQLQGVATGPISENTAYRLSVNQQQRDGLFKNSFNNQAMDDLQRWSVRGQLRYDDAKFHLRLKMEQDRIDEQCCASMFYRHQPYNAAIFQLLGGQPLITNPYSAMVSLDNPQNYEQDKSRFLMRADWTLNDEITFSSISSYQIHDSYIQLDLDSTELEILSNKSQNQSHLRDFSQEFRWQSPLWVGGILYLNQDYNFRQKYLYGSDIRRYYDIATAFFSGVPLNAPSPIDSLEFITGAPEDSYFSEGQGLQNSDYNLNTNSLALYGEREWALTERLNFSAGLRWTIEKQGIEANYQINDPFSALDLSPTGAIAAINPGFSTLSSLQIFKPLAEQDQTRNDNYFSGGFGLRYKLSSHAQLYSNFYRGVKSGGFQITNFITDGNIEFDRETVDAIEFGLNLTPSNQGWHANIAVFDQFVDGYQLYVMDNNIPVVKNADEVEIQGVEIDGLFHIHPNLALEANATYLNARFVDFNNGPCYFGSSASGCDFSGKSIPAIPDWTASTSLLYSTRINTHKLMARLQYVFKSERYVSIDRDPDSLQGNLNLFNASVSISAPDQSWTVSLWSKNLTNEAYSEVMFNSVVFAGDLMGVPAEERTIGLSLSVNM